MRIVRFTRHYAQYNAGEGAGFPDDQAQKLIDLGVAVEFKDPQPTEEVKAVEGAPADKMVRHAPRSKAQGASE
jgi:hypothetical protein